MTFENWCQSMDYDLLTNIRQNAYSDTLIYDTFFGMRAKDSILDRPTRPTKQNPEERETRLLPLDFTGTAGEFFRIWIVNITLTILTLGIYGAWAKVRTRRYFHVNTLLDGQAFDYLARPGTILKGHLIVAGAILLINFSNRFFPLTGFALSIAAWCSVPYLLYKAHRFKLRNSAYRNIRFHFTGGLREAYKAYAIFPLAALFSLIFYMLPVISGTSIKPEPGAAPNIIIIMLSVVLSLVLLAVYPYFAFLHRRYFHENMAYGKTAGSFRGKAKPFYGIYASAVFMMLAAFFFGGLLIGMSAGLIAHLVIESGQISKTGIMGITLFSFISFALLFTLVRQYIYSGTFNYAWKHTRLGPVEFDVSLKARDLAWIRFTNILAIVLSVGLLIPWAKVRRARYIITSTVVSFSGDMDAFEADTVYDEGAVGDTAADFFDLDFGW